MCITTSEYTVCSSFSIVFDSFYDMMASDFLSWDAYPSVPSTIKRWDDDEFLSWDRPVSVKQRQVDDNENISKTIAKSPRSTATRKPKGMESNENACINSNELRGTVQSGFKLIYLMFSCFSQLTLSYR